MVLTYSDDTLDVAGIKAEMALDRINKKIAMTSKVLSTDYENIIDKFKPTAEMRRNMKEKLVRNLRQDFDIGFFENLLNLYEQKDESGKSTWDIQAILDDIETNISEQLDGMYT